MERHSRLLTSNAAPEPAEVAAIRGDIDARTKAIDGLQITLRGLDAELERLEAERRRVEEQRQSVQGELRNREAERNALGGLLTSFRRFPMEILSQIFIAVYDDPEVKDKARQVAALFQVCRRWCNAAMCTARLWCQLKLSGHDLYECDLNKLSRRFSRSGMLARKLDLDDLQCGSTHQEGATHPCELVESSRLVEVLARGPRLHGLSLSRIHPCCLQRLASKLKGMEAEGHDIGPWKSLKYLSIHIAVRRMFEIMPPLADMLADLPLVPSFHLSGSWDQAELHSQRSLSDTMIMKTITTLHIEDLSDQSSLTDIAISSNVHTLIMTTAALHDFELGIQQPIVLQELRVLRLEYWPSEAVTLFLQVLRAPRLSEFCMVFYSEEWDPIDLSRSGSQSGDEESDHSLQASRDGRLDLHNSLTSFLHQSAALHTLHIDEFVFPSGALEKLLFSFPSLTHLTLENVLVQRFPFRPVHELPSDTYLHLLPHLESLCLANITGDDSCYEGVCAFFGHRATDGLGIKNMKTLTLEMDRKSAWEFDALPDNALRQAVTGLRKLGVDVYVRRYRRS